MNAKEIAKQYEENRVKVLPLLEELVEQFKKDKSSLDIQQLQLITGNRTIKTVMEYQKGKRNE